MFNSIKAAVKRLPGVQRLLPANAGMFPPGHFYSPIPSLEEVRRDERRIFGRAEKEVPGVDMREAEQVRLVEAFAPFYAQMPFADQASEGLRFHFDNPFYSYADGIFYHCMIRHLRPRRIIEIGSGYSSAVALDTNERFFDRRIELTFIEPYPERLQSLMRPEDAAATRLLAIRLQDAPLDVFRTLESGDILFVDSTHVSKVGSDVNMILFEVLPSLAPGVHVHVHDIFFPFEYPKSWVMEGRAWNEAYLLRAFLQYNSAFRVVLMSTFLAAFHRELLERRMPLSLKDPGGSIWLART